MKSLSLAGVALLLLAACSSSETASTFAPVDADATVGEGENCVDQAQSGNRACVPGEARSNTPLSIAVDAPGGCLSCPSTMLPCTVDVSGTAITLSMTRRTCAVPTGEICSSLCQIPGTTCMLPALAAGTYVITVAGETAAAGSGVPPRQLVVTDAATETSCTLAQDPAVAVDPAPFAGPCTQDSDCAPATTKLCGPCACPTAAIAKTANAAFAAAFRAAQSQCAYPTSANECAACAPTVASCNTSSHACEVR